MRIVGAAVLAAFLLSAPWLLPKFVAEFWVSILAEMMIWGLLASSANLLLGYTGLLSFGQSLYFGFGAYGVAFGITRFGLGVVPSFFLAVAIATLAAVIAGFFAVRLTWHYFAIITVVFSLIFYLVAVGWKSLTGGDDGLSFALPPIASPGDAATAMGALLKATADGELTPLEAGEVAKLVDTYIRTVEANDLTKRIEQLERTAPK